MLGLDHVQLLGHSVGANLAALYAGAVVTTEGPPRQPYELSGDAAWDYSDIAAAFREILGREVVYRPVTPDKHLEALKRAGVPDELAAMAVVVAPGFVPGRSPSRTAASLASSADPPPH